MEGKECIHDEGCHLPSMTRGMNLHGSGWSCRLCPKERVWNSNRDIHAIYVFPLDKYKK